MSHELVLEFERYRITPSKVEIPRIVEESMSDLSRRCQFLNPATPSESWRMRLPIYASTRPACKGELVDSIHQRAERLSVIFDVKLHRIWSWDRCNNLVAHEIIR